MRTKIICILMLLLVLGAAHSQNPVDNRQRTIVFENVNVISMDGSGNILENQNVVVSNGKITHIGKQKIKFKEEPLIIHAKGKYLIPGLSEMHAHVPPVDDLEVMKDVLMLYALNGITTIRGMLGHPKHLELRAKIASGEITGPRFYTSGPSVNGQSTQSPAAAAAMVRDQKNQGYDFLKLHPGLTREKFDSIVAAAKQVGIPFAGHVSYEVGVWRAIEAGYASIDHLDGFVEGLVPGIENMTEQQTGIFGIFIADQADTTRIPELMEALHRKNIWVVPTQSLAERWFSATEDAQALRAAPEMKYIDTKTLDQWVQSKNWLTGLPLYEAASVSRYIQLRRRLIKACHQYQVGLLLGSDAPQVFNVPGFSTHHELKYLVDAGLTPYEALETGTRNVGRYFQRTDIGTLQPGAVSDLVLLAANPLVDINNTKKIEGVMLGNTWMPKEHIEKELEKRKKSR